MPEKTYGQSKKARSTAITQGGILVMIAGVLYFSGGDPVKASGLATGIMPLAGLFLAAGGVHVMTQGAVDGIKASKPSGKPE